MRQMRWLGSKPRRRLPREAGARGAAVPPCQDGGPRAACRAGYSPPFVGSVIKKRRKKMRKHKHKKMLKKTRWQRRAS
jgi:hypothetical protein